MDELSAERFRLEMNEKLNTFLLSSSNETLSFPPCRSFQRSLIHRESVKLGLSAKSKGKGDTRHVVVSKPCIPSDQYAALLSNAERAQKSNPECGIGDAIATTSSAANRKTFNCDFEMNLETAHLFRESDWMPKVPDENRFKKPPVPYDMSHVTDEDLFKLQTDFQKMLIQANKARCKVTDSDRLTLPEAVIPAEPHFNDTRRKLMYERSLLPVMQYKSQILDIINNSQISLVVGETGSGKSTQIPQFIIEQASINKEKCRVIVTEPRRIAALTIAERCAQERGEYVGQTVGYQIRLEKKISSRTALTFCTNGILLRTLIGARLTLNRVTHLIIDEVHERDRMSDFLITVIKQIKNDFPHLRVILMSATLNVAKFKNYFENAAFIEVPGRSYHVQECFLEDVLVMTNYGCIHGFNRLGPVLSGTSNINESFDNDIEVDPVECQNDENKAMTENVQGTEKLKIVSEENDKIADIKITDQREIDKLLDFAFERASVFDLVDLVSKIESLHLDGLCRHSVSGVTPLAVVSSRGEMDLVKKLVNLGYVDEYSLVLSKTLAYQCGNQKVHSFLNSLDLQNVLARCSKNDDETENIGDSSSESNQFIDNGDESIVIKRGFGDFPTLPSMNKTVDNPLLNQYFDDFIDYDDQIDVQLIGELVFYIFKAYSDGAILIFLPGYEDIVAARDRIGMDMRLLPYSPHICALHSQMSPKDQKEAFLRPPSGSRKIILSTNIAEVSVTINDVVFVIDCGKMKEKVYDGLSGISMLSNVWISKANAVQRKGRAGRCSEGFCYRLYSKLRFENMPENPVPEILRVPLHELCLQTKLMFPEIDKIQNILSLAPDAPSQFNIRNAICLLKIIGAMTENESLTTLGRRICELPLEPQYGKMVLFSILFKCVDPILTIVACLSYKDPFILPKFRDEKQAALKARRVLSPQGMFSDHFVLLRAYDQWLNAYNRGNERQFCSQNFASSSCLNMIYGIREQLKHQLFLLGYFGQSETDKQYAIFNKNSQNWSLVKACLTAGLYPYLAFVDKSERKIKTSKEVLEVSPYSTLLNGKRCSKSKCAELMPTNWLIYNDLVRIKRSIQIKSATAVTSVTVALMAGNTYLTKSEAIKTVKPSSIFESWDDDFNGSSKGFGPAAYHVLEIDEISFKIEKDIADKIMCLREKIMSMFIRLLHSPWTVLNQSDEVSLPDKLWGAIVESVIFDEAAALEAVSEVLRNEDKQYGLDFVDTDNLNSTT